MKTSRILMAFVLVAALTSCEKDTTGDVSRVTNYPLFEITGDDPMFIDLGTAYAEPGVTATENGQDIPVESSVVGHYRGGTTVDENISDWYTISYSATNKDGFVGTVTRDVYVVETGDLLTNIAGLYSSTVVRSGAADPTYEDMEYVLIWKNSDGTYQLSCGIGGYYQLGRFYGLGYRASPMKITANDISTNDFTVNTFSNITFGGSHEVTGMMVDEPNKQITFTCDWDAGYTFEVTLTQVEI